MDTMTKTLYLSMIVIGVGSFIFGILPIAFSFRGSRSCSFSLSLILCLGAGVLLATSLVHMLTEVQEKLKFYSQLYFCAGFLGLYMFDEISHYCLGSKKPEIHVTVLEFDGNQHKRGDYGTTHDSLQSSENSRLLEISQNKQFEKYPSDENFEYKSSQKLYRTRMKETENEHQQQRLADAYPKTNNEEPERISYTVDAGPRPQNSAARTGLLLALLIHSVLEGISIGIQTKTSQILLILGAVTFHKVVLSFCLGLELLKSKTLHLLAAIFFFSIGSPIGIFLGMTVTSLENGIFGIDAELQAAAAGSLLYVATFEVLPRERIKWEYNSQKKGAGILQLIFVLLGFTCITAFHILLDTPSNKKN